MKQNTFYKEFSASYSPKLTTWEVKESLALLDQLYMEDLTLEQLELVLKREKKLKDSLHYFKNSWAN